MDDHLERPAYTLNVDDIIRFLAVTISKRSAVEKLCQKKHQSKNLPDSFSFRSNLLLASNGSSFHSRSAAIWPTPTCAFYLQIVYSPPRIDFDGEQKRTWCYLKNIIVLSCVWKYPVLRMLDSCFLLSWSLLPVSGSQASSSSSLKLGWMNKSFIRSDAVEVAVTTRLGSTMGTCVQW